MKRKVSAKDVFEVIAFRISALYHIAGGQSTVSRRLINCAGLESRLSTTAPFKKSSNS